MFDPSHVSFPLPPLGISFPKEPFRPGAISFWSPKTHSVETQRRIPNVFNAVGSPCQHPKEDVEVQVGYVEQILMDARQCWSLVLDLWNSLKNPRFPVAFLRVENLATPLSLSFSLHV